MYIQQADLLRDMERDFVKDFLNISTKKTYEAEEFLFHAGDDADCFYILVKGNIRLSIGSIGHVVHVIDHTGEAFGWSALVGRSTYSASAQCVVPTKVLRIRTAEFQRVMEKYPLSGRIFFRRLAKILGERLLRNYEKMPGVSLAEMTVSYGSGQVADYQEYIC